MSIKNTKLDKETQFVISLHISGTCMTVAVWHNHGRQSVVKTTSATSEASRLFEWGFFGVKTVVLPEKFACNFFIFWLHFYHSRQTFEAKKINPCTVATYSFKLTFFFADDAIWSIFFWLVVEKNAELGKPEEERKYKGRAVFQWNNV